MPYEIREAHVDAFIACVYKYNSRSTTININSHLIYTSNYKFIVIYYGTCSIYSTENLLFLYTDAMWVIIHLFEVCVKFEILKLLNLIKS